MRFVSAFAVTCLLIAVPQIATAGTLDGINVGLHLQPRVTKNNCTAGQAGTLQFACNEFPGESEASSLNLQGELDTPYDLYVVLLDIPPNFGIQGIEFGISFDGEAGAGLDTYGVEKCADQEFSGLGWPNAGGSVTYTWISCQNTVDPTDPDGQAVAVASVIYAYAYSDDQACITVKASGVFGATDCAATSSDLTGNFPWNAGCVGFDQAGFDPCLQHVDPVEETTWGAIKQQFGEN